MKLKSVSKSQILFENLIRAETIVARTIGLMGRKDLPQNEAWWFTQCKSIHTCFMRIPIDCVFVDSNGKVVKIYHNLKPWRVAGPVWKASAAVEMRAGSAKIKNLVVGDIIECGP